MSLPATGARQALAADAKSLNALKFQAGQQSPEAIKETAKQLESLFMRELIKSMRDATMKSGMLDSAAGDLGQDLLDQQLAGQISGRPGGLSDLIAQQLSRQSGVLAPPPNTLGAASSYPAPLRGYGTAPAGQHATPSPAQVGSASPALLEQANAKPAQARFVQQHDAAAQRVAQESGIPASFMVGQAALETGWGQREIKMADGSTSFNLFGIKANPQWKGKVAEITTTEFINGAAQKVTARFRAYDSYEASFRDYARMINQSPRYAQARQETDSAVNYATRLQQAGYATDPDYANKLSRVINSALKIQRALG